MNGPVTYLDHDEKEKQGREVSEYQSSMRKTAHFLCLPAVLSGPRESAGSQTKQEVFKKICSYQYLQANPTKKGEKPVS